MGYLKQLGFTVVWFPPATKYSFLISFTCHFYGSYEEYSGEQIAKELPVMPIQEYLYDARFWFESFQNWQS
ncbi:MAG: hypothetical protein JO178_10115 [Chryseobacterium sp.]|nr:DUF6766 family protein [Chryseobacterium sp.]MBV8326640.1 hypothetical protein [Chryseobacterium sp.]